METIKKLDTFDMSDTVYVQNGWDRIEMPEPTKKNMLLFMRKINELTETINVLLEHNRLLTKETTEL